MPQADQPTSDFKGDHLSVLMNPAVKADGVISFDGAINASDSTFTSASINVSNDDIGKRIWIRGAGASGLDLLANIASINSPTSLELDAPASTTVSNYEFRFGTNNLAGIQDIMDLGVERGLAVYFPRGRGAYLFEGSLVPYHNLILFGDGYSHNSFTAPRCVTQLVGLTDVPLINYTGSDLLQAFQMWGMSLRGTERTGSKGIYLSKVFGVQLRDIAFDWFGDQGLHIEDAAGEGFDGLLLNLWATNVVLKRTGRTDWIGGLDVRTADVIMQYCRSTCSTGIVTGVFGDGYVTGIVNRGANFFMDSCFGHLSETGIYFSPTSQQGRITSCRSDLNQGPGFIVDGSGHQFTACASHANSMDSVGGYSGYLIPGAGNQFLGCRNTYNGVGVGALYSKVLNGFEFTNSSSVESNHCPGSYVQPTSFTNKAFEATGTQKQQVVTIHTNQDIPGRALTRNMGDLCVENNVGDDGATFWIRERTATSNNRLWCQRVNNPTNLNQLLFTVWNDALTAEGVWGFVTRSGVTISALDLIAALITLTGAARVTGDLAVGGYLSFDITTAKIVVGSGSPEGVVTAVGGSLFLDGAGKLWAKVSGTGNTGWGNVTMLFSGSALGDLLVGNSSGGFANLGIGTNGTLLKAVSGTVAWQKLNLASSSEVENALAIANGGTGAATAADARTNLSVYSQAEVDALIAAAVSDLESQLAAKAAKTGATSFVSGHSHVTDVT